MDISLILQLIVLFGAIFLGVRLGGMAIGYAGGIGVVVLTLGLGLKAGSIPWDVILIIMSVIAAITAMQVAGGLDYTKKTSKIHKFLSPSCHLLANCICRYWTHSIFYDSSYH